MLRGFLRTHQQELLAMSPNLKPKAFALRLAPLLHRALAGE